MIYYTGFENKTFGKIFLAKTEKGLCIVTLRQTLENFIQHLQQRFDLEITQNDQQLAPIVQQLNEYFKRRRKEFQIVIDWDCIVSSFDRKVLQKLVHVPFGQRISYQGLAQLVGKPKAARAVGNALGRNPMPIIIPCHRVVRKDGGIGGYSAGIEIKCKLLELESYQSTS
ncbi:MAG TPA: methylated-DNA--[protein]-cysteine S-methyltransferase [Bacteroidetes bacterium]|nr:methylated-DNA--[protein]-cysteine S-methyltransferase [Bacteroidota bacterium]